MKYVEIGNKLIIIHTRFLGGNVLRILGRLLRSPPSVLSADGFMTHWKYGHNTRLAGYFRTPT